MKKNLEQCHEIPICNFLFRSASLLSAFRLEFLLELSFDLARRIAVFDRSLYYSGFELKPSLIQYKALRSLNELNRLKLKKWRKP